MKRKIILITWWLGYIGSHWVVAFEQSGYKTVIIDSLINSSISTIDWIQKILWYRPDFFEYDLRDKKSLETVFEKYNFDWVVHFAWLKAVWESCEKPIKYFDNNLVWSIHLYEIMEKYNVKNIIFSSSATVYNPENTIPYNELQKTWVTSSPYGTTKFLTEKILEDLSKFSWFRVVNLRYFNPIWAHESWFIWEDPNWIPNNLLPYIMKVVAWELPELKIFGNDYDTKDGTWVRDYIDVADLIQWHLKAYESIKNDSEWFFKIYNLWSWIWTSVLEIINISEKVTWITIPYSFVDRRMWDISEFYCNPDKVYKELWWKTKINLEKSISNGWNFINKNI